MALFDRSRLPSRSTFSLLLAALDQATMEALWLVFQQEIMTLFKQAASSWNTHPTPFVWGGKRPLHRQRTRQRWLGRLAAGPGLRVPSAFSSPLSLTISTPMATSKADDQVMNSQLPFLVPDGLSWPGIGAMLLLTVRNSLSPSPSILFQG